MGFLENLVLQLYNKEYFGFKETAKEYVNKILDFIYEELPTSINKPTPKAYINMGLILLVTG